jgi:predicted DCC family thiol-disulfide oxidoreductase YuxK
MSLVDNLPEETSDVVLPGQVKGIVFFDGVCIMCSGVVQWMVKRSPLHLFCYSPLQGETFTHMQKRYPFNGPIPDSVILWCDGRWYTYSEAILKIAQLMPFPARFWVIGYVIPPFIRNRLYRYIARKRYAWFGVRATCMVPDTAYNPYFLP